MMNLSSYKTKIGILIKTQNKRLISLTGAFYK